MNFAYQLNRARKTACPEANTTSALYYEVHSN